MKFYKLYREFSLINAGKLPARMEFGPGRNIDTCICKYLNFKVRIT